MLEIWKGAADNYKAFRALLNDLSLRLLIAKVMIC